MLEPIEALKDAELEGDYTLRLALTEEFKSYPFGAIWDYYCAQQGVPVREQWITEIKNYEQNVLLKRQTLLV
ncbi:L-rhamnose isomerase [compost metagenome]